MNSTVIAPFYVIGIAVRTTNENNQAAVDIPWLWNKFMTENSMAKIVNKTGHDLYCLYTDYEGDYTKPYTTILGCKVDDLNSIPDGFTGKMIEGGTYGKFTATGALSDAIVFKKWQEIWNTELPRAYTTDFEIYGSGAADHNNAAIDIFVGTK